MKNISKIILKNKILLISLSIILLVLCIYLLRKNKSNNKDIVTTTSKVTQGSINLSVSASGKIETANYLAVTTSVNGIVKKVHVQEGDKVVKGQKIMEIILNSDGEENRLSAYASYLTAKINLNKANNDLLTKETSLINEENLFEDEKVENSYQTEEERDSYKIAENSYLVAKSEYDRQKEAITQAEVSLNKAWLSYQAQSPVILAPDNGIISNILVVEGMNISNSLSERTSSTVASIRKEGTPIASLNITEVDINKIKVGQKVILVLNSIEGKNFYGKVVGIDKIGTTSAGVANYPVIVKFDESSDFVLPNMGVDAEIIIEEKQEVILVPTPAIKTLGKETTVTVLNNNQPQKVVVETGISNSKFTEIISGLNIGDIVQIDTLPIEGFNSDTDDRNMRMPGMGGFMR